MKPENYPLSTPQRSPSVLARWLRKLIIISVLVIFVGLLLVPRQEKRVPTVTATNAAITGVSRDFRRVQRVHPSLRRPNAGQTLTAEEIVANKVAQFTRKRRELVWVIAKRSNKEVP